MEMEGNVNVNSIFSHEAGVEWNELADMSSDTFFTNISYYYLFSVVQFTSTKFILAHICIFSLGW
jgi:hypothetical protein